MISNPFTFGNPIRNPNYFIGRQSDLRQIVSRLCSSAHESTSIVGERRIGKTSLLKYLENKDVAANFNLLPEEFCLVYMDFQGLTDITPLRFWQRVLEKIERVICTPSLIPEIKKLRTYSGFDLFDLEDLFTLITEEGLTVVLLLDEFEYVTQNPNFGPDFFGGLRTLAIHHNLPLVTATRRELVDLCHSEEIKGSPFFNIFANIVLKPFSEKEVDDLLKTYLDGASITFTLEDQAIVQQLGGGYPFFTQIAAFYLYETKFKGLGKEESLQEVTQQFDSQADAHYSYMWSKTSESEKITLLTVITRNKQVTSGTTLPTLENLARIHSRANLDIPELIKRGMVIKDNKSETYHILSSSFEHWIAKEILASPGEEESEISLSEFLTSTEHDDVEPISGILPKFKKKYWPLLTNLTHEFSIGLIGNIVCEIITKGIV